VKGLILGNMAGHERAAGCLYESVRKKRMKKRRANKKKSQCNFACDKLDSPSAIENSASAMHDVSREESDLSQQDVCEGKYVGESVA